MVGGVKDAGAIADGINHYIEQHGYRLLHLGEESGPAEDGKIWHYTVAILGHDHPPAPEAPGPTDVQTPTGDEDVWVKLEEPDKPA
jgi:hypothetical protein